MRGRTHPAEQVEGAIHASVGDVRGCAALVVPIADDDTVVVIAEVTDREGARRDGVAAAIRRAATRGTGVPIGRVLLVPPGWLPKTSSGKVQRSACRHKATLALAAESPDRSPG